MKIHDIFAQISSDTTVNFTIGIIATTGSGLVAIGWKMAMWIRDIRDDVKDMRRELADTWNLPNMKDWCHSLERKNRTIPLVVPDPTSIRSPSNHGESNPPL